MCCKLFEKVYSVFISHFKTKIYPNLARIFADIPTPLREDDLQFQENDEEDENPKTFQERLEAWKLAHTDDLFSYFIPTAVKEFNQDFQAILDKMTLENLVVQPQKEGQDKVQQLQTAQKYQWIHRDRKIRLIECVDEILHFFMLRSIQMDLSGYESD